MVRLVLETNVEDLQKKNDEMPRHLKETKRPFWE